MLWMSQIWQKMCIRPKWASRGIHVGFAIHFYLQISAPLIRPFANWQFYPDIWKFGNILGTCRKIILVFFVRFLIIFNIFDPGIWIFISKKSNLLQREIQAARFWTPNSTFHGLGKLSTPLNKPSERSFSLEFRAVWLKKNTTSLPPRARFAFFWISFFLSSFISMLGVDRTRRGEEKISPLILS